MRKNVRRFLLGVAGVAVAAGALGVRAEAKKAPQTQASPDRVVVAIEGRSGVSLTGEADIMMHGDQLMITVTVKGAPPGSHAVHIHEKGDCSAPDAMSAGGHFNPGGHAHGAPDAKEHHAGDFGNMEVGADGSGRLMLHSKDLSLSGPNSVLGRAIIIHEKADDFVTQPTGNAGGRIGCGVIQ